jgi:hypothetical protein
MRPTALSGAFPSAGTGGPPVGLEVSTHRVEVNVV